MNAVKKTVAGAVILGGMLMAAWGTGWQSWNRPGALTRVESYSLEALAFRGREMKETTDPGIVRSDHTHQKDCGHATTCWLFCQDTP